MSESTLVPFRIQALSKIESLDAALIPCCPIDESPTVSFVEAAHRLMKNEVLLTLKIGLPVFSLGVIALILAVMNGFFLEDFAINLGTIFMMVTIYVSRLLMLRRKDQAPFRQLHERVADSQKRWLDANRIKRLTGTSMQEAALRQEIESFNADISGLNLSDCTSEEHGLIVEKRRDLNNRICEFRQKMLAPAPDRLEQKLLSETIMY